MIQEFIYAGFLLSNIDTSLLTRVSRKVAVILTVFLHDVIGRRDFGCSRLLFQTYGIIYTAHGSGGHTNSNWMETLKFVLECKIYEESIDEIEIKKISDPPWVQ